MDLPFADGAFDLVVSTEVLEHTPDPGRGVAELVRVARPGGTIVITTPNRRWHGAVTLSTRLGLRPYEGVENWMSFAELESTVRAAGVASYELGGFNAVPLSAAGVQRTLRRIDRLGRGALRQLMVNMYVIARR